MKETLAPRLVRAEPLTAEAFAPFGQVIEPASARRRMVINGGSAERFHDLAAIDPGLEGRSIVSIFRGQPRQLPFPIVMLERHPLASQAFVPLSGNPYLVVVAPPTAAVDYAKIRFFRASAQQGVNFAPGVWHHPLLALDSTSDFLVIDRDGPGANCDEVQLEQGFLLLDR